VAFLTVLSGCDLGSEILVRKNGRVTRNGRPIPNLFLNFVPDKGRPSWGLTDADGNFVTHYDRTRDGIVPGMHTVFVTYKRFDPREGGGRLTEPEGLMPILAKFGKLESTPLRIEIKAGTQSIDLRLD
jgi:hypothetical protein